MSQGITGNSIKALNFKFYKVKYGHSLKTEMVTQMKFLRRLVNHFFKITLFLYDSTGPNTNATWQLRNFFLS
jgi:hypothetical protein